MAAFFLLVLLSISSLLSSPSAFPIPAGIPQPFPEPPPLPLPEQNPELPASPVSSPRVSPAAAAVGIPNQPAGSSGSNNSHQVGGWSNRRILQYRLLAARTSSQVWDWSWSRISSSSWMAVSVEGMLKSRSQIKGGCSLVLVQECSLLEEWRKDKTNKGSCSLLVLAQECSPLGLGKDSNSRHWGLEHSHWWTVHLMTVGAQGWDGVCLAIYAYGLALLWFLV